MNYNILFDKRLSIFKGFIKYIKDDDYHGKIMIANSRGVIHRPRDNCSNENLHSIDTSITALVRLKKTIPLDKWKARVLRDTSAQIQFLGQCLMDRFYAKHMELTEFFKKYSLQSLSMPTPGILKKVLNMSCHEYPLYLTLSILRRSMRLRQMVGRERGWGDMQDSFIVTSKIRLMISEDSLKSMKVKDKLEELSNPRKFKEITNGYYRLLHSKRWKQLIESIENAKRNMHSKNSFELALHKQRMENLLKVATSMAKQ